MATEQGADERRIRSLLRRRGVGPDAPPPVPAPARDEDWLDRLYADEPAAPDWHSVRKAGPVVEYWDDPDDGVQVTIRQPAEPGGVHYRSDRRARHRKWLAVHGAAAFAGWTFGWEQSMAGLLDDSGQSAPAVGVGLICLLLVPALFLPHLRIIPPGARSAVMWACRIPACTAALALALHAPAALI